MKIVKEKTVETDDVLVDLHSILDEHFAEKPAAEALIFTLRDTADLLAELFTDYDPSPDRQPNEEQLRDFYQKSLLISAMHQDTFDAILANKKPLMEAIYGGGNWK